MSYKIEFDRDKCLGCGACTRCDNWGIADDGKASPVESEFNEIGCNSIAVDICPVKLIKLIKNKK